MVSATNMPLKLKLGENKRTKSSQAQKLSSTRSDSKPSSIRSDSKPSSTRSDSKPSSTRSESKPSSTRSDSKPSSTRSESKPSSTRSESKPSSTRSDHKLPTSKSPRHHSSTGESIPSTPTDGDPVFDGGNNNISPLGSPQSAPEYWDTPKFKYEQKRRPKSVSEPPEPDVVRSKESNKPGRNRAFSVSRSGKFKEAKRRTSMLEIQDRFDKAAKDIDSSVDSQSARDDNS